MRRIVPYIRFPIFALAMLAAFVAFSAECVYLPKASAENPQPEFGPQGKCGELLDADTLRLHAAHFEKLDFAENGLAVVLRDGGAFYVSSTGKVMRTHFFDNGADYFVEGLARTVAHGKFGFMDEALKVVVAPEYDFAFPFADGLAVVCQGCRSRADGEHRPVLGGKWGKIDKAGKIVIPIIHERENLP